MKEGLRPLVWQALMCYLHSCHSRVCPVCGTHSLVRGCTVATTPFIDINVSAHAIEFFQVVFVKIGDSAISLFWICPQVVEQFDAKPAALRTHSPLEVSYSGESVRYLRGFITSSSFFGLLENFRVRLYPHCAAKLPRRVLRFDVRLKAVVFKLIEGIEENGK